MTIRIAVPVANDLLCAHFGQCESFALFDVDAETATIVARRDLQPPPHEHGAYPKWLADQGTTLVIAGGMGGHARALFDRHGIETVLGADEQPPQTAAIRYLRGDLPQGPGHCDHGCDHETGAGHGEGRGHGDRWQAGLGRRPLGSAGART